MMLGDDSSMAGWPKFGARRLLIAGSFLLVLVLTMALMSLWKTRFLANGRAIPCSGLLEVSSSRIDPITRHSH
jgi:hypothetical protein